jgi:hypothetical protein
VNATELAIDACCLLNLLATAREVEIVEVLGLVLLTTPKARAEVQYLAGPRDEDGQPTRTPVDTGALERAGRLVVRALDPGSSGYFEKAAERLRDADASVVALAVARGASLATDDAKVRRNVPLIFPELSLRSTLWLVRGAAGAAGWAQDVQRAVALGLLIRGNFLPPKKDPDRDWFAALLR